MSRHSRMMPTMEPMTMPAMAPPLSECDVYVTVVVSGTTVMVVPWFWRGRTGDAGAATVGVGVGAMLEEEEEEVVVVA
jgi:hypothetical protein